jgi:hypothetical protein
VIVVDLNLPNVIVAIADMDGLDETGRATTCRTNCVLNPGRRA